MPRRSAAEKAAIAAEKDIGPETNKKLILLEAPKFYVLHKVNLKLVSWKIIVVAKIKLTDLEIKLKK